MNRKYVATLFKKWKIPIHFAHNGKEAVEKAQEQEFDLILMDISMPEMDGYEATKSIRNGEAGDVYQKLYIVAMTANAMKGDREKCLDSGMDEYIAKPISYDKVAEMLDKCLSKQT